MDAAGWVGAAVGATVLLGVAGRLLWAIHKGINLMDDTRGGVEEARKDIADLHAALNNGVRAEIRGAREEAKKAQQLAGDAARAASIADQHASEGRIELGRSMNALRSELDVYTNVVITDRSRIWAVLTELGFDGEAE